MAERYAVAAGNWVAATFDGGTLPGVSDTVHANGFAVTIDTSITVGALSTRAGAVAVAGGSFTGSGAVTVTGDTYGGTTTCLTLSGVLQQQIGDSYGSLTTNSCRGTLLTLAAKQVGNAFGGENGPLRDGTVLTNGASLIGNSYGSDVTSSCLGASLTTGSRQIGDSYGGASAAGTQLNFGSIQYGKQIVGSAGAYGTSALNGSLVITTGITGSGLLANGNAFVILQNGVTAGQVNSIGSNLIGESLDEFPFVGGGGGFSGIRGIDRNIGT